MYALPSDVSDWVGDGQAVTVQQIRRAEIVIDDLTFGVAYDEECPDVRRALRAATCAQVAWFNDTGDTSGALGVLGSASIGSVSLGAGVGASSARLGETRYAPEAVSILRAAGLLQRTVVSR